MICIFIIYIENFYKVELVLIIDIGTKIRISIGICINKQGYEWIECISKKKTCSLSINNLFLYKIEILLYFLYYLFCIHFEVINDCMVMDVLYAALFTFYCADVHQKFDIFLRHPSIEGKNERKCKFLSYGLL